MNIVQAAQNYQTAYDKYWSKDANPVFIEDRDNYKNSKSQAKIEAKCLFINDKAQYVNIANKFNGSAKVEDKLIDWKEMFSEKFKDIEKISSENKHVTNLGKQLYIFDFHFIQLISNQDSSLFIDKQTAKKTFKTELKHLFKAKMMPKDIIKMIVTKEVEVLSCDFNYIRFDKHFREYQKRNYSDECFSFLTSIENYRNCSPSNQTFMIEIICSTFIAENAPKEINISGTTKKQFFASKRQLEKENNQKLLLTLFDDIYKEVFADARNEMKNSYSLFKSSKEYRDMLEDKIANYRGKAKDKIDKLYAKFLSKSNLQ